MTIALSDSHAHDDDRRAVAVGIDVGAGGVRAAELATIAAGYRRFRMLSERTPLGAGVGYDHDAEELR